LGITPLSWALPGYFGHYPTQLGLLQLVWAFCGSFGLLCLAEGFNDCGKL
jgi:hypothetical protein